MRIPFLPREQHWQRGAHVKSISGVSHYSQIIEIIVGEVFDRHAMVLSFHRLAYQCHSKRLIYRFHHSGIARHVAKETVEHDVTCICQNHHIMMRNPLHAFHFMPACFATSYLRILVDVIVY